MKNTDLETLINPLLPKFYAFSFCMIQDDTQAEQLIIDAYSVFIVREKNFIEEYDFSNERKERASFKKYLFANMIHDIFELSLKRTIQTKYQFKNQYNEYDSFYQLDQLQRATLFLKEKLEMSIEGIEETLRIKKHQVIESLHNARFKILEVEVAEINEVM